MSDLQKVGQGHGVQLSQLHHSMANVKNLQIFPAHCCASSFQTYKHFKLLTSKRKSKLQNAIFAIRTFDAKCQNLQMSPTHFCASSYNFRDKKNIFYLKKVFQCLGVQLFHSMANVNIYRCLQHAFALALTVS